MTATEINFASSAAGFKLASLGRNLSSSKNEDKQKVDLSSFSEPTFEQNKQKISQIKVSAIKDSNQSVNSRRSSRGVEDAAARLQSAALIEEKAFEKKQLARQATEKAQQDLEQEELSTQIRQFESAAAQLFLKTGLSADLSEVAALKKRSNDQAQLERIRETSEEYRRLQEARVEQRRFEDRRADQRS